MKKISCMSLLLCLLLLLQLLPLPVFATETDPVETLQPTAPEYTAEELGDVTVSQGCRTIDAQMPLGGNSPMLKTARASFIYEVNTNTVL